MKDPAAIALGDQMQAHMTDVAGHIVRNGLADEGVTPTADQQEFIDIGIAAGMTAAMQVLVAMGLIKTGRL